MKREVRKILLTSAFFALGFCLLLLHNRLLTRGSGIELASYARAMIGGLIVAKVLLTVNLVPFVHAFPHKPLVYNVAWKSSLYIVGSIVFLYLEPFIKSLFKGVDLYASHSQAWQEVMLPKTWSIVVWLAVLMVGFVTMQELSRVIGKDRLKQMFFGERDKPAPESRFRDVA